MVNVNATSRTISEHMFPFSSCSCFKDTIDELMWFLGQSTSIVKKKLNNRRECAAF